MTKRALLQVADTGPLDSLIHMLESVGYACYLPDKGLQSKLRNLGCDTVLAIEDLVRGMGYEPPLKPIHYLTESMLRSVDLYVDVKAHRNGPKVWAEWPELEKKTLWYRINGGQPEHVVNQYGDHGNEINPPCPVLTPNQWYKYLYYCQLCSWFGNDPGHTMTCPQGHPASPTPFNAYVCWPPFVREADYYPKLGRPSPPEPWINPVCLIHNLHGWGYGRLVDSIRGLGVKCFGAGSPDGLLRHSAIPSLLAKSLCMVHLKSNDAPGYALYEALAAGCPVVCTRRIIWRCKMQDLLIPEETCLVFDRETHEGLSNQDVKQCSREVRMHMNNLRSPALNQRIGMAGRQKLLDVMWNKERDSESLVCFLEKNFP